MDYAFFALMFAIATALSPPGASEVGLQNERHPDQWMAWSREGDGRWAMTIRGREMGHFQRSGSAIVHHIGQGEATRYSVADLLDPADLRRDAPRLRLTERFDDAVIDVQRNGGGVRLVETARRILATPLRVRTDPPPPLRAPD